MSSPLYLLRRPPDSLPLTLYSHSSLQDPVLAVGKSDHSSSPVVTVIRSGEGGNLPTGKDLSYQQLLDVLLAGHRIIAL
jgi:hypothetical protein